MSVRCWVYGTNIYGRRVLDVYAYDVHDVYILLVVDEPLKCARRLVTTLFCRVCAAVNSPSWELVGRLSQRVARTGCCFIRCAVGRWIGSASQQSSMSLQSESVKPRFVNATSIGSGFVGLLPSTTATMIYVGRNPWNGCFIVMIYGRVIELPSRGHSSIKNSPHSRHSQTHRRPTSQTTEACQSLLYNRTVLGLGRGTSPVGRSRGASPSIADWHQLKP